jgi:hypothetical protein
MLIRSEATFFDLTDDLPGSAKLHDVKATIRVPREVWDQQLRAAFEFTKHSWICNSTVILFHYGVLSFGRFFSHDWRET